MKGELNNHCDNTRVFRNRKFFTSIEILNHGGVDKDSKEVVTCSKYWQVTSTARQSQLRPTNSLSAHFEYLFGNRPTRPANLLTNVHSICVLVTQFQNVSYMKTIKYIF